MPRLEKRYPSYRKSIPIHAFVKVRTAPNFYALCFIGVIKMNISSDYIILTDTEIFVSISFSCIKIETSYIK